MQKNRKWPKKLLIRLKHAFVKPLFLVYATSITMCLGAALAEKPKAVAKKTKKMGTENAPNLSHLAVPSQGAYFSFMEKRGMISPGNFWNHKRSTSALSSDQQQVNFNFDTFECQQKEMPQQNPFRTVENYIVKAKNISFFEAAVEGDESLEKRVSRFVEGEASPQKKSLVLAHVEDGLFVEKERTAITTAAEPREIAAEIVGLEEMMPPVKKIGPATTAKPKKESLLAEATKIVTLESVLQQKDNKTAPRRKAFIPFFAKGNTAEKPIERIKVRKQKEFTLVEREEGANPPKQIEKMSSDDFKERKAQLLKDLKMVTPEGQEAKAKKMASETPEETAARRAATAAEQDRLQAQSARDLADFFKNGQNIQAIPGAPPPPPPPPPPGLVFKKKEEESLEVRLQKDKEKQERDRDAAKGGALSAQKMGIDVSVNALTDTRKGLRKTQSTFSLSQAVSKPEAQQASLFGKLLSRGKNKGMQGSWLSGQSVPDLSTVLGSENPGALFGAGVKPKKHAGIPKSSKKRSNWEDS